MTVSPRRRHVLEETTGGVVFVDQLNRLVTPPMARCACLCGAAFTIKTPPLPCVPTAIAAKTPPSPGVSAAFAASDTAFALCFALCLAPSRSYIDGRTGPKIDVILDVLVLSCRAHLALHLLILPRGPSKSCPQDTGEPDGFAGARAGPAVGGLGGHQRPLQSDLESESVTFRHTHTSAPRGTAPPGIAGRVRGGVFRVTVELKLGAVTAHFRVLQVEDGRLAAVVVTPIRIAEARRAKEMMTLSARSGPRSAAPQTVCLRVSNSCRLSLSVKLLSFVFEFGTEDRFLLSPPRPPRNPTQKEKTTDNRLTPPLFLFVRF